MRRKLFLLALLCLCGCGKKYEKCPQCGNEFIYKTSSDGTKTVSCFRCGWQPEQDRTR